MIKKILAIIATTLLATTLTSPPTKPSDQQVISQATTTISTQVTALPVLTGNVKVMIAGDSIAGGMGLYCPDGTSYGDRYAFGDWLALNSELQFTFVGSQASTCHPPYDHHEGHGGWTIGQLADNIIAFLNANPAHILILRVGVNDAKASGGYRNASQMITDYKRLIDNARIQNPNIRILASEQIPTNGSKSKEFADASKTIKEFNALLPGLVAQYDDAVHIGSNAQITTLNLFDGLHPDVVGYLMIAWFTINDKCPGRGIWTWLSVRPPAASDAGALRLDPFAAC